MPTFLPAVAAVVPPPVAAASPRAAAAASLRAVAAVRLAVAVVRQADWPLELHIAGSQPDA